MSLVSELDELGEEPEFLLVMELEELEFWLVKELEELEFWMVRELAELEMVAAERAGGAGNVGW